MLNELGIKYVVAMTLQVLNELGIKYVGGDNVLQVLNELSINKICVENLIRARFGMKFA